MKYSTFKLNNLFYFSNSADRKQERKRNFYKLNIRMYKCVMCHM